MKMKMILVSMLAVAVLAGCSDKNDERDKPINSGSADVAYISIKIDARNSAARSSGENEGANESDLKTLYLIFFDDAGNVVGEPGATAYFTKVEGSSLKPTAVKVSAAATKLLVIANPGMKLEGVLTDINATTTFGTVNLAIKGVDKGEIVDEVVPVERGFTMINSGDEEGKAAGDKVADPLIGISDKIQKITDDVSEEEAKKAAEKDDNRVLIRVERLASKVEFKLKGDSNDDIKVEPSGATFAFGQWTLDAVNGTFFPFAEKTLLGVTHSSSGSYAKSFYTRDPNFTDDVGLVKATVHKVSFEPQLAEPYTWMDAKKMVYCLENTMSAAEQDFGNATRVVIKGTFYPANHSGQGDWFSFAGRDYADFAALKAYYEGTEAGPNFKAACEKMYVKIKDYADAHTEVTLIGTSFETLVVSDLLQIKNGGEVIKDGKNPVIRWYQAGLCYYYYEIRHDNETTKDMDFGKYGVVRNNWYQLTLGSVNGAGTPWYPDIDNPGPGDPDPTDPIDGTTGYLGITVDVARWIIWENEIGI